jgi:hypothetical protein
LSATPAASTPLADRGSAIGGFPAAFVADFAGAALAAVAADEAAGAGGAALATLVGAALAATSAMAEAFVSGAAIFALGSGAGAGGASLPHAAIGRARRSRNEKRARDTVSPWPALTGVVRRS